MVKVDKRSVRVSSKSEESLCPTAPALGQVDDIPCPPWAMDSWGVRECLIVLQLPVEMWHSSTRLTKARVKPGVSRPSLRYSMLYFTYSRDSVCKRTRIWRAMMYRNMVTVVLWDPEIHKPRTVFANSTQKLGFYSKEQIKQKTDWHSWLHKSGLR